MGLVDKLIHFLHIIFKPHPLKNYSTITNESNNIIHRMVQRVFPDPDPEPQTFQPLYRVAKLKFVINYFFNIATN